MYFLILLSALLTMGAGAFIEDEPTAVINGRLANIEDYPFYALLTYADNNLILCGSSIISNRVLLTAAHCVDIDDAIVAYVGVSSLNELKNSIRHEVKKTIMHPDYDILTPGVCDIALVKLKKRIKLGPTAQTIALGTSSPDIGEETIVLGFGAIDCIPGARDCNNSDHLRITEMMVNGYGVESAIESVGVNSNVCYGDSGGPMVYDNAVVGVASSVDAVGCMTDGNTYTAVYQSLDWIKKHGKV